MPARLDPGGTGQYWYDILQYRYDVEQGSWELVRGLGSLSGKVDCVVLAPDGIRAVWCGEDKTVVLWNVVEGKQIGIGACPAKVRWADFSPDGRRIVSACYDGTVAVCELPVAK
jgi:WD40 repeat protein